MKRPITISVEKLRKAAPLRHVGYMEACLHRGQLSADGKMITFTPADYAELRRIYNPNKVAAPPTLGCC